MTNVQLARNSDRKGNSSEAIKYFAQAIRNNEYMTADDLLDAAVLFFLTQDSEFVEENELAPDICIEGWDLCLKSLSLVTTSNESVMAEVAFWRDYFQFIVLGYPQPQGAYDQLKHSLVPVIYLIQDDDSPSIINKSRRLYGIVSESLTGRERYVFSVLHGYRRKIWPEEGSESQRKSTGNF